MGEMDPPIRSWEGLEFYSVCGSEGPHAYSWIFTETDDVQSDGLRSELEQGAAVVLQRNTWCCQQEGKHTPNG